MSPSEFAAVLVYSHADEAWVKDFHADLEACLRHLAADGGPERVFFDPVDVGAGRSWIDRVSRALDSSQRVILVVTPASVASPSVEVEWQSLLNAHPDWLRRRLLLPVQLLYAPLPRFPASAQPIELLDYDEERYREALAKLLAGLGGDSDDRNLPELPPYLVIPDPPSDPLGNELRRQTVDLLGELLEKNSGRLAVATAFGQKVEELQSSPAAHAASAAVWKLTAKAGKEAKDPRCALADGLGSLAQWVDDSGLIRRLHRLRAELVPVKPSGRLPAPLRAWLGFVPKLCEEVATFGPAGPERRELEKIYVDLPVHHRRPPALSPAERGDPHKGGGLLMEDLLALPTEGEESATGRWVVLGEPGAGKTTLLRHLALSFARQSRTAFVPVFVRIPEVLASAGWFLDECEAQGRKHGAPAQIARALDEAGRAGRLVVLADGLDEVAPGRRDDARRWLHTLAERWPPSRIVVGSRPQPYERPGDDFQEVEIQPLAEPAQVDLVARYLAGDSDVGEEHLTEAGGQLGRLRRDPWLSQLAGNPLYLGFLALLVQQDKPPSTRRHALYAQVIDLLLRCDHRPDTPAVSPLATIRALLALLAHAMTEDDEGEVDRERLENLLVADDPEVDRLRRELQRARAAYRDDVVTVFDDVARTGLFAPYADTHWRFLHRTFREALTAQHLAAMAATPAGLDAVLAQAASLGEAEQQGRWAEPFAQLTGQVQDADGLLTALLEVNRPLVLRALGSTRGLRPATVRRILDRLEDRDERAQAIRSLPQVLEDGCEVLELVDELRGGTRSGDDLFWLDWVVRQVARRDEELAPEADALLDRFYDHIPAPSAELFSTVEIREGRRVPLWCEAPAGEFRMGSPEDEEGRDEDEGPRHRVTFRSGFRIAAVPVTRAQYRAFDPQHVFEELPGIAPEDETRHPADRVTWYAAVAFCRWLAQALPQTAGARLPTEPEWEYACRAGSKTAYCSGEGKAALDEVGWYKDNSDGRTHAVGEQGKNDWGLYDVHGNVWEWTLSRWPDDYSAREEGVTEPGTVSVVAEVGGDPGAGYRVFRGGSYADDARGARSAYRYGVHPWFGWRSQGFRVVLARAPSAGA